MAKKQGGRLLSSAGLVNYYESEDRRAIHISPITVMVVAAAVGIILSSWILYTAQQHNIALFYRSLFTHLFSHGAILFFNARFVISSSVVKYRLSWPVHDGQLRKMTAGTPLLLSPMT